jgi:prepilin-type N-terminal cleavage/methylation domain-containing protein
MFLVKKNLKNGFTLVELLVTISIFVLLTGVVLFNQNNFNSSILLTNLAYDTALTIRQAQTYGINVKEFATSSSATSQFVPYGVHFNIAQNKSFILFADIDYDSSLRSSDGFYDSAGTTDLTKCQLAKGCVNRYNIQRGNHIKELCLGDVAKNNTNGTCVGGGGLHTDILDIVFTRPNPDAKIRVPPYSTLIPNATIILSNADNTSYRYVHVAKNGLIEIKY